MPPELGDSRARSHLHNEIRMGRKRSTETIAREHFGRMWQSSHTLCATQRRQNLGAKPQELERRVVIIYEAYYQQGGLAATKAQPASETSTSKTAFSIRIISIF